MAKIPYRATNRKEYTEQMCRFLDRGERIRLFSALVEWHAETGGANIKGAEDFPSIGKRAFQNLAGKYLPQAVRDIFKVSVSLCNETTAFQLRQSPSATNLTIRAVQLQYDLPNLHRDLSFYFCGSRSWTIDDTQLPFEAVRTWVRLWLQLKDPQDVEVVLAPVTIEASPPTSIANKTCAGRCSFVLLKRNCQSDDVGI